MQPEAGHQMQHRMFRLPLGDWHVVGMGQVFPVVTTGGPDNGEGGCQWPPKSAHLWPLKNAHFSGAATEGAERPERGLPMESGHPS